MESSTHFCYPLPRLSRPDGPGLRTTSRLNDFELYRPARRAGFDPLTTTQEGVGSNDDSSILPSPGQVRGKATKNRSTPNPMNPSHPFDLVIGLDRSDAKADLHLIDTRTGQARKQTLSTSPEALHDWLAELRQQHPEGLFGHRIPITFRATDDVHPFRSSVHPIYDFHPGA